MYLLSRILNFILCTAIGMLILVMSPFVYSKWTNNPIYTSPEFSDYMKQFRRDAAKNNTKLDLFKLMTVFSSKVPEGVAAYCLPNIKLVVVSKQTWDELEYPARKALLYHEWGHCILRRDHTEAIDYVTYCPISIMYPYIEPMKTCYQPNQESYIRELFTNPHNFETFSRRRK